MLPGDTKLLGEGLPVMCEQTTKEAARALRNLSSRKRGPAAKDVATPRTRPRVCGLEEATLAKQAMARCG